MGIHEAITAITITGGSFLLAFGIVAVIVWSRYRTRKLRFDTIRIALEKGQPLPPDLLDERRGAHRTDLQRGVITLCLGAGVCLFLAFMEKRAWPVGLVLVALGLGQLLSHLLRPKDAPPGARG